MQCTAAESLAMSSGWSTSQTEENSFCAHYFSPPPPAAVQEGSSLTPSIHTLHSKDIQTSAITPVTTEHILEQGSSTFWTSLQSIWSWQSQQECSFHNEAFKGHFTPVTDLRWLQMNHTMVFDRMECTHSHEQQPWTKLQWINVRLPRTWPSESQCSHLSGGVFSINKAEVISTNLITSWECWAPLWSFTRGLHREGMVKPLWRGGGILLLFIFCVTFNVTVTAHSWQQMKDMLLTRPTCQRNETSQKQKQQ